MATTKASEPASRSKFESQKLRSRLEKPVNDVIERFSAHRQNGSNTNDEVKHDKSPEKGKSKQEKHKPNPILGEACFSQESD